MKYPITLVPGGVMPRDPDMKIRLARVAPVAPVVAPTVTEVDMPFMGVSAWSDAQQAISIGAGNQIVTFDRELYDTDSIHDIATDNHLFTVPVGGAGKWSGQFQVGMTVTGSDSTPRVLWRVNENIDIAFQDVPLLDGIEGYVVLVFPPTLLADGDTVEVVFQPDVDIMIGSDQPGPNAADPYCPAGSDSAFAAFWRVGK